MQRGHDQILYILPFDHASSFEAKLFGWKAVVGDLRASTRPYRDSGLSPAVTDRPVIEQGAGLGRDRYVDPAGQVIGMKTVGASAPPKELQRKFGFQTERVVATAKEMLGRA